MYVEVRNNNVDRAIRNLRKKLDEDGIFKKLRQKMFYEKPSEERRRLHRAAVSRHRRDLRDRTE